MTRFTKENLIKSGPYIHYRPAGERKNEKFVARFKRMPGAGSFMTHLRKNWTVEDYFAEYDSGTAPLTIAEKTGYLLPHIKRELKRRGYPLSKIGFELMITEDIAKWKEGQVA